MSQIVHAPAFASKLEPIADTFKAWRQRGQDSRAVALDITGQTPREVLDSACASCSHKDVLLIERTDGFNGKAWLTCYMIRHGKAEWRRDPADGQVKKMAKDFADEVFCIPLAEPFVPTQPWRWTPGCDAVGVDQSTVEAGK